MRFVPENLILKLDKSEVKIIVEYLTINQELNEKLILKVVKYGNKIPEGNKINNNKEMD